ncbi:MAG: tetratricopeptide repeat protein, partial [Fimbriimonas sp.]
RLDRLEWPAAQALLADLAESNELLRRAPEADWQTLHRETGGNPLLMRWIVGQMQLGRKRKIVESVAFLHAAPPGNDPLEYVFGDLLETFTESETKVLAALTHFTIPVETKFIAELAGINPAAAEGDLAMRALVQPDLEDRRFTLVALVADFLRRRRPEAIAETGDRLANRAYALIVENGYQKHDRFSVLDAAWPTVAPALPHLIAGPNDRLRTVCDALDRFLEFTGRWDEWLSLCEQAEAKAVTSGDLHRAGWRAYQASWVAYLRGEADAVLAGANRADSHWTAAKAGARERAAAIRLRGVGHELKKNYPAALSAYRESLELWRSLSAQRKDVASGLSDIAEVERQMGDFDAAECNYIEALRIARAVSDPEGVAIYTGNLANLKLDQEKWPEAETLARKALTLSEGVGRIELVASNCHRIAEALLQQNKSLEEALRFAQRAVELFTQLGSKNLDYARATLRECEAAITPSAPPES